MIGPFEETHSNDNGKILIDICWNSVLNIMNNSFNHKDKHGYTWSQNNRNLKLIIDNIILRQTKKLHVQDIRVYRGVSFYSDYHFVMAKILIPYRKSQMKKKINRTPKMEQQIKQKKVKHNNLIHDSSKWHKSEKTRWKIGRDNGKKTRSTIWQYREVEKQKSMKLWWNGNIKKTSWEKEKIVP